MNNKIFIIAISFIVIVIALIFIAPYVMLYWAAWTTKPFVDKTPQELFTQFVLDDDNLQSPSKFGIIEGLERQQFLVPLKGPVYIHFKADDTFVKALINRHSKSYEPYEEISCDSFFEKVQPSQDIDMYPKEFEWWRLNSFASSNCYRSERKSPLYDDEAKYLLIDSSHTEVYFYRTVTPQTVAD